MPTKPATEKRPSRASAPAGTRDRRERVDIAEALRKKARTVRSRDLAERMQNVRVLDFSTLRTLFQESVDDAVEELRVKFGEDVRDRLLSEAEEIFEQRLAGFHAQKKDLQAQTWHLRAQLQAAKDLLEEERQKVVQASQFTVSDAGMVELEARLGRVLDHALKTGNVSPSVEDRMRGVVQRLLDDERDKIRERVEEAHTQQMGLLERKVGRLASALERAQRERDRERRRAQALEAANAGPGFKPVMQPGISDEDPDREKRLLLMKEVFQSNVAMREELERRRGMASEAAQAASSDGDTEIILPETRDG